MARVNTYLNFVGKAEEAFNFYKTVFKYKLRWSDSTFQRHSPTGGNASCSRCG